MSNLTKVVLAYMGFGLGLFVLVGLEIGLGAWVGPVVLGLGLAIWAGLSAWDHHTRNPFASAYDVKPKVKDTTDPWHDRYNPNCDCASCGGEM